MPAEIEEMFFRGELPWHGFGREIKGDRKLFGWEAVAEAGLDWTVAKVPLKAEVEGVGQVVVPEHVGIIRQDTNAVLGVVGTGYAPVQNREVFALLDDLVRDDLLAYETAGSLRGGRNVWALAKAKVFEPVAGDPVGLYGFVYTAHDGSSKVILVPTSVRVVCANTARMALDASKGAQGLISIRHTSNAQARLEEAKRVFDSATRQFVAFEEFAKRLAGFQMTTDRWGQFINAMVEVPEKEGRSQSIAQNTQGKLLELFEGGRGQDIPGVRGTGWAAFNSVTEFVTHERTTRGADDDTRRERRFEAAILGSGDVFTQKAVGILGSMVQAA